MSAGRASATKQAHARILLKADEADGGPAWPDARIAEAVEVSVATAERWWAYARTWLYSELRDDDENSCAP